MRTGSAQVGSNPAAWSRPRERPRPVRSTARGRERIIAADPWEVVEAPVSPETRPEIQAAQLARVQTRAKYGMTVAQVAEVYRIPLAEIERVLSKAREKSAALPPLGARPST